MATEPTPLVISRPLSPHLQVYKPQLTSMLSILHRITGASLSVGSALLVLWLWTAAYSPSCFAALHRFLAGPFGIILLIGWSFAFYYHLCNGIRHLFWDMGKGFEIHIAYRNGWIALTASLLLTAATWAVLLLHLGGTR